ncbi:MAG: hypothetical protein Q7J72_07765 [Candidatus Omnitrophota bacterium]|nr:hypothetical protein [Candidatus Omnitrophota bacterium]
MEKNEVYDYLAKVYLDKQPLTRENKKAASWKRNALFLIVPSIVFLIAYFFLKYPVRLYQPKNYYLSISTADDFIKIKYYFNSAGLKTKAYTIDLQDLDLSGFKALRFEARHLNEGSLSLRIEIENSLKEASACYVSGLESAWKEFEVNLDEFHAISEWNKLKSLSFIVEEWNAQAKEDCVYINAIGFNKKP